MNRHARRLDKLQENTRARWEELRVAYWEEILSHFSWPERHAAEATIQKWFDSPLEHKADEASLQQHFTETEISLLQRIDAIWKEQRFETMRDIIEAQYVALQACERVRT